MLEQLITLHKLLPVLLPVFSIMWRRRPAAGGVLPGWRPTQPAWDRLFPALQTGLQPELPGRWVSLPVPLERRRVADGKQKTVWMPARTNTVSSVRKRVVLQLCASRPRISVLCRTWSCCVLSRRRCCHPARGEEMRELLQTKIRWSFFFFLCKVDNSCPNSDWPTPVWKQLKLHGLTKLEQSEIFLMKVFWQKNSNFCINTVVNCICSLLLFWKHTLKSCCSV